jgi:CBS domain-containing protein
MKDIAVQPDITIRQAMKNLSETGQKCLVITDEENMLLGTLSDGDLRKAILKGAAVGDSIDNIYQQRPTVLVEDKYSLAEVKKLFLKHNFDLIPIVNEKGMLKDMLFLKSVLKIRNNHRTYYPTFYGLRLS